MSENVEIRLWDTQWMKIVNADYSGMSKEEAIATAIKKTEEAMACSFKLDNWPPAKARGEQP